MGCFILNDLALIAHGLGRGLGQCSHSETVLVQAFLPDSSRNSRHKKDQKPRTCVPEIGPSGQVHKDKPEFSQAYASNQPC